MEIVVILKKSAVYRAPPWLAGSLLLLGCPDSSRVTRGELGRAAACPQLPTPEEGAAVLLRQQRVQVDLLADTPFQGPRQEAFVA